jgi:hypothetical protein
MKEYREVCAGGSGLIRYEARLNELAKEGFRFAFVIPPSARDAEHSHCNPRVIMERDVPDPAPYR